MNDIRRALTDSELGRVVDEASAGGIEGALVATYDALLGDIGAAWASVDSIDPKRFSIPTDQISVILEAAQRFHDSSLGKANAYLTWMNVGPSALELESAS